MNFLSIPVLAMGFLAFFVGVFYIRLFIRRRKKEELFFGLSCISITFYDIFSAGLYSVASAHEALFWHKHQFVFLILFSVLVIWFIFYFDSGTKKYPRLRSLLMGVSIFFLSLLIIGLVQDNIYTVSASKTSVNSFSLYGLIDVIYYEAEPGLIFYIQKGTLLFLFTLAMWLLIKRYYEGMKHLKPIIFAMGVFFISFINDTLVGMNFYHFIYLMEYAFILLIMAMSSILLDRYFSMYKQIAKMNINLEEEVVARTEELKAAMDEMEKINETLTSTNQALEESQVTINRDMKMASNVQKKMMCHGMPVLQGWDIHVVYKPMSAVSGDFYDFYLLEETFGGVSLFDVSGHGVSSGLITLLAKSFAYRAFYSEVNKGLHDIISQFQKTILQEIREVDHYLSGIMLKVKEVRQESVVMEYVNAGHPCIIKKDRDTGKAFYLSGGTVLAGVPLGLDGIESGYDVLDVTIGKGDSLFLYTDGLKEQMNKEGGSFGEKGIVASLEQASGSSQEILEGVLRDFDDFRGNEPMGDDLTTIVITRV